MDTTTRRVRVALWLMPPLTWMGLAAWNAAMRWLAAWLYGG